MVIEQEDEGTPNFEDQGGMQDALPNSMIDQNTMTPDIPDAMVPPQINQPQEMTTEKSGCQTQTASSFPMALFLLIGYLVRRRMYAL
jgi:hypothetical protein